jgi:hypothetical protein
MVYTSWSTGTQVFRSSLCAAAAAERRWPCVPSVALPKWNGQRAACPVKIIRELGAPNKDRGTEPICQALIDWPWPSALLAVCPRSAVARSRHRPLCNDRLEFDWCFCMNRLVFSFEIRLTRWQTVEWLNPKTIYLSYHHILYFKFIL